VLPSSRALLLVGLLAAGLLPTAGTLAAQEIPATAILELGPEQRRGIDAIAPDVTPYWYGRYRVGSAEIELSYVEPSRAPPPSPRTRD